MALARKIVQGFCGDVASIYQLRNNSSNLNPRLPAGTLSLDRPHADGGGAAAVSSAAGSAFFHIER